MALKAIIREGDITSHGGYVVEGFHFMELYGRRVAGKGHVVSCPRCKGARVILEGIPYSSFHGVKVAVEGMMTSCGAVLIASQNTALIEDTRDAAEYDHAASKLTSDQHDFDRQFQLIDQDGAPLSNIEAHAAAPNGNILKIKTDESGKSPLISGNDSEFAELKLLQGNPL